MLSRQKQQKKLRDAVGNLETVKADFLARDFSSDTASAGAEGENEEEGLLGGSKSYPADGCCYIG